MTRLFLPFAIVQPDESLKVPMGDALMAIPIAKGLGVPLFLPPGFVGDLIELLADVPILREMPDDPQIATIATQLYSEHDHPYAMSKWGSAEHLEKYGPLNATQYMAKAIGISPNPPYPVLRRPKAAQVGKVVILPNGSVPHRSLRPRILHDIVQVLEAAGKTVIVSTELYEDAAEYADLLAGAEYVVSTYTGPMHLAAGMGVKTIAIPVGDSTWAYRPLQPNTFVLSPACDRCWFEKPIDANLPCGEKFPFCQRVINGATVLAALNALDDGGISMLHLCEVEFFEENSNGGW